MSERRPYPVPGIKDRQGDQVSGIMETLTIESSADLLSFIGHTLGFWPQESLVCLTLDINHIGATLRVDVPRHDGAERTYARSSRSTSRPDAYDKGRPLGRSSSLRQNFARR